MDYTLFDAALAGFQRVVLIVRDKADSALAEHVTALVGQAMAVTQEEQRLEDMPPGYQPPPGREKPWGTAHAVLSARAAVTGGFAVVNADDFYGRGTLRALAEYLPPAPEAESSHFAMVAYPLESTLSLHGGVARGVCQTDSAGFLTGIEEIREIRAVNGEFRGVLLDGRERRLVGKQVVSMNAWAFIPAIFALLEGQFTEFLRVGARSSSAEFYLSAAVGEQVARGESRVEVLPGTEGWFGMTFAADRGGVQRHLKALVEQGIYPPDLAGGFAELDRWGSPPGE